MKPRLAISFSGGRSSFRMLKLCLELYDHSHDILITFMNTGEEREETLDFVHAVDQHIGGRVVWLEAEFHERGKGPTAKVVTFETASRNGEPFRAAIEKHGVFGPTHPQCNSRLKTEPMRWYRQSIGWEFGSYDTAIGIRADEIDRQSQFAKRDRLIYPLIRAGITKPMVNLWCRRFDFDLKLQDDADGNCKTCWKKSLRKLMTIAKRDPHAFDFFDEMETKHGSDHYGKGEQEKPRTFFRENRSAKDIVRMAQTENFKPYRDDVYDHPALFDKYLDLDSSCGGSCEAE